MKCIDSLERTWWNQTIENRSKLYPKRVNMFTKTVDRSIDRDGHASRWQSVAEAGVQPCSCEVLPYLGPLVAAPPLPMISISSLNSRLLLIHLHAHSIRQTIRIKYSPTSHALHCVFARSVISATFFRLNHCPFKSVELKQFSFVLTVATFLEVLPAPASLYR